MDILDKLAMLFCCSTKSILDSSEISKSISYAFRANSMTTDDLKNIATINKIALNLEELDSLSDEIQ